MAPLASVGPGKFFLLGFGPSTPGEAASPRYASFDLLGVHASDFRVPYVGGDLRGFFGTALARYADGFTVGWTSALLGTESATVRGSTLAIGYLHPTPEALEWNGPAVSQSRDGRDAVLVSLPGHVSVVRRLPQDVPSWWTQRFAFDVLEADDTTGSVHHTMLSPDGTKLYVGIDDGPTGDRADVLQLELASGNRTLLGRALGPHSPSFALGPDGIVYVGSAQPDDAIDVLGAIHTPDATGEAASFEPSAVPLALGCDARRGLVNIVTGGMRLLDTDRDGAFDMVDGDNDHDGLTDLQEGGVGFVDSDYDATGILGWNLPDASTCAVPGTGVCTTLTLAIDPDRDGLPSPDDLDSDGDGIPDLWECGGAEFDADGDGRVDGPVEPYSGMPIATTNAGTSTLRCGDADDDGIVNLLDLDSDNDGLSDREEANGSTGPDSRQSGWSDDGHEVTRSGLERDTDGDGIPDWLDPTDDRVPDAGPEAGVDAGGLDAGDDAGSPPDDAGTAPAVDSGVDRGDAGPGGQSSGSSPRPDSSVADEPSAPGVISIDGGGCSCRASNEPPVLPVLAALVMSLGLRRRRRSPHAILAGSVLALFLLVACGSDTNEPGAEAAGDEVDATDDRALPDSRTDGTADTMPPLDGDVNDATADAMPSDEDASVPDGETDAAPSPTTGALDPAFTPWIASFGRSDDKWIAADVDGLGRVLTVGTVSTGHMQTWRLARWLPDGALDLTFGTDGFVEDTFASRYSALISVDATGGFLLLVDNLVRRFDDSGRLDVNFDPVEIDLDAQAHATSVEIEEDGAFLVSVARYDAVLSTRVHRFTADGEPDHTWYA